MNTFELDPKIIKWAKDHAETCDAKGKPQFLYKFLPTNLWLFQSVKCTICKKEKIIKQ